MQLTQCGRILNGNLRGELAAPLTGAYSLTARAAIDIAAALQFNQVTAVAEDDAVPKELVNRLHRTVSACRLECLVVTVGSSQDSNTTAVSASAMPRDSRQPIRSSNATIAIGMLI